MQSKKSVIRAIAALAAAAACAMALDAAAVLAVDAPPTTRPAKVAPSTQPLFVGGAISNDYARSDQPHQQQPTLMSSGSGRSSANAPATISVGGGVDAGQTPAAPMASDTSLAPVPTTRPATR